MKLSVKSDYAARAVMGLSRRFQAGQAVKADDLAEEQGIPPNYLVQILIELKSRNIVKSLRGKSGGYLLARPPAEITLGDVLRSVHGAVFETPALSGDTGRCPEELVEAWKSLQDAVDAAADKVNFQALLERGEERMYYI